ncbi:thiamine-phosphate kinase [Entomomonas asaccharolytica]|uniref:Thiamine-monophosphate kinase n=1 Tax=Entomomonas asaccharolytica TaxID=2785331 RepID=A0A974NER1_9GAMM|nr:thiamine-phosphate kinase [Entomomonas asaccharolytica]QQP85193.1 thiamine-phosphate kinase [Entomomonas asaccharolytica]
MGEFELIQHYFKNAPCATLTAAIALGIGDDCALLKPSPAMEIAISTDTLVADVHFPTKGDPFFIAQRALAVTVSDLAAMGAKPIGFTLALTLPEVNENWLQAFAEGLCVKAKECAIQLIGGDTTKGPLAITITVLGEVPMGKALRRDGAQVGDLLCISGCLGEAAGALPMVLADKPFASSPLLKQYWSPIPQLVIAMALRDKATACLDISDGLLADCEHIAKASQVALVIELDKLRLSADLQANYPLQQCQQLMLTGGDDYQLAFTIPTGYIAELENQYPSIQVIGRVEQGQGVKVIDNNGQLLSFTSKGYQHF